MSATDVLAEARRAGRAALNEIESKEVLAAAGIPTTAARLARSREEAIRLAGEIGYPVVLKIVSEQILHKSDIGGVRLNLADAGAVGAAYDAILEAARTHEPDATVEGVAVQQMAAPGTEVIVGMTRDPRFGPVLMFGLGGVLVEVLQDVAFRLAPLTPRDAQAMMSEIKARPLLEGFRGAPPADRDKLAEILIRVGDFALEHPDVKEIDLNPIYAYPEGALAVDARIILEQAEK